jgi:8-oxo-dGTP pyrophosphatase MutT (NUDIX family)
MSLLATIRPQDIDPDAPAEDYAAYTPRAAVRVIVFDGERVALVHVSRAGYYMLPGGGTDDDDIRSALVREVREELGCEIAVDKPVGDIVVYFDRWRQKQTDTCFIAHKTGESIRQALTNFEVSSGFQPYWAANIAEAAHLVRSARPVANDGKLIRARDLLFLEAALQSDATMLDG